MAKKETKMQSNDAELKAIAKAVGASLTRNGHKVPHSNLLHALSAALDKRNWSILKASLHAQPETQAAQAAPPGLPKSWVDITRFWARLAYFSGNPLTTLSQDAEVAVAQARKNVGATQSGALKWSGWNVPADLSYADSVVDAGDFKPDMPASSGRLTLRYLHGTVTVEVGYVALRGWYVSATGAADFFKALEKAVPDELILGALDPLLAPHLPGPAVVAEFWTDDQVFEVSFDAREYLSKASDKQLKGLIEIGYRGDEAADAVAEHCAKHVPALKEAFDYLDALNKSSRDTTGFECSVDSEQFLRWMDVHRRPLLAKILCKRHDVCVATAVKEGRAGAYCWELREEGEYCEEPLETAQAAELDAYLRLELLEREIRGN